MPNNTPFNNNDVLVGNAQTRDCSGVAPGASGNVLTSDGTKWGSSPGGGGADKLIIKYKAADGIPINNSTVLVADPDLKFDIGANEIWQFENLVIWTTPSGGLTTGLKFDYTGPAAPTTVKICAFDPFADIVNILTAFSSASPLFGLDPTAGRTNSFFVVYGLIINGVNPDTVQLRLAQGNAVAENTKDLAGSYLIAHKIG